MKLRSRAARIALGVLAALAVVTILRVQPEAAPPAGSTPDTIKPPTKRETPRQTASVWTGSPNGPNGAFEAPDRAEQLHLPAVFNALKIHSNSVVADIGAGGGWLTMRLSRRVGPNGVVYAEEITKKYTGFIAARAEKAGVKNVRPILGTTDDPKLPDNTLDAAIILNAYHEFEAPLLMLRKIHKAMKTGARLGFIERDTDQLRREAREAYAKTGKIKRRVTESRDANSITDDHRLAADIIEREALSTGFEKVLLLELRDYHYLLVVQKKN
jgi:ubiquinone/menaquinone biosynthesis C-methylase UbiE